MQAKGRSFLSRLKPSLQGRLTVAMILVGLLPVGFAAYRLIDLNRGAMTSQVENTHALAARSAGERIGAFMASRLSLANGLAGNPALADPRSMAARTLLSQNLQAWAGLGVQAVAIVDPEGGEVIRAQLRAGELRERVDRLIAQPPDGLVVSQLEGDTMLLRIESSLPEGIGRVWLICVGNPLLEVLDTYELGREADLALADASGRIIAGSLTALSEIPAGMLESAASGVLTGVQTRFESEEGEFIGAFAPVPYVDWFIVSRQPLAVAHAVATEMRREAGFVAIGALIMVGLLSIGSFLTVVRPIRGLVRAQNRLAGVAAGAASGSEIEQLEASFKALARRVDDQEALEDVFLGRYRVVGILGSGAMGTVFRGFDPKLKRWVALKTVRMDASLKEKKRRHLIAQLMQEAVMVARFNHPNIVQVFDVEDRPEGSFVAMEFVEGISLELLLWQITKLEPGLVIPLGAAIARALAVAHKDGVVHRDVKPANVLLGSDDTIKVSDFGIAEFVSKMSADDEEIFGTPGYLSPEILQGKGVGPAGDLFALGVILYECLTGIRPFAAREEEEEMSRTVAISARQVRDLEPDVSDDLAELVMKLLKKDPEQRTHTADEVAEVLESWVDKDGAQWKLPATPLGAGSSSGQSSESRWVTTLRMD